MNDTKIIRTIVNVQERLKPCPDCKGQVKIEKTNGVYDASCRKCGLAVYEDRFKAEGLSDMEQIGLIGQAWNDYVDNYDPEEFI